MNTIIKPTIVYDGDCPFCQRQMALIQHLDKDSAFHYLPKQADNLLDCFPQLAQMNFETGLRLVDIKGKVFVGADAVYYIAKELKPFSYLAWLYQIPGLKQLCRFSYKLIAQNRRLL